MGGEAKYDRFIIGEDKTRLHPWLKLLCAVVAVVFLVYGLVVAALTLVPSLDPTLDDRGLAEVQHRLTSGTGDLNAIPDPANTHPTSAAEVTGCEVDSGQVFEPGLYREWRFIGPAKGRNILDTTDQGIAAAVALARALKGNGWAGSAALDRDAATDLVKSFDGYMIRLVIQADGESVLATGSTDYKRVCRS